MDIEKTLKQFIEKKYGDGRHTGAITPDLSLLETGLLDSISIFEMVTFLEIQFDVEIQDDDILPEHFNSINSIAALVKKKLAEAAG